MAYDADSHRRSLDMARDLYKRQGETPPAKAVWSRTVSGPEITQAARGDVTAE
jgi:hypothetical protein